MAWLSGWDYRVPVTVVLDGWISGRAYSHCINLVYLAGQMEADFGDVRVTLADGTTLVDMELFKTVASTSTQINVLLPAAGVGQLTTYTFYIYYGNSGQSAGTDPSGTACDFFDAFSDSSLDTDKWEEPGIGNCSISEGPDLLDINQKGICTCYVRSKTTFSPGNEFTFKFKLEEETQFSNYRRSFFGVWNHESPWSTGEGFGITYVDGSWGWQVRTDATIKSGLITSPAFSYDEEYVAKLLWHDDNTVEIFLDDVLVGTSQGLAINATDLQIHFTNNNWGFTRNWHNYIDWVCAKSLSDSGTGGFGTSRGAEEEYGPGQYSIRYSVEPQEELTTLNSTSKYVIASEIGEKFFNTVELTNQGVGFGTANGFADGAAFYKEVTDTKATIFTGSRSVVFFKNTGYEFSTSAALGDANTRRIEIYSGTPNLVSSLGAGEAICLYDTNGEIPTSNLYFRTVEADGSAITGTGNALEHLVY